MQVIRLLACSSRAGFFRRRSVNRRTVMRFSTGYGPRPAGGGFETFSWYFMRITAIGLIFLVIIHLFINHVTTDVACTSYQLVAGRYANPYWRRSELLPRFPRSFTAL